MSGVPRIFLAAACTRMRVDHFSLAARAAAAYMFNIGCFSNFSGARLSHFSRRGVHTAVCESFFLAAARESGAHFQGWFAIGINQSKKCERPWSSRDVLYGFYMSSHQYLSGCIDPLPTETVHIPYTRDFRARHVPGPRSSCYRVAPTRPPRSLQRPPRHKSWRRLVRFARRRSPRCPPSPSAPKNRARSLRPPATLRPVGRDMDSARVREHDEGRDGVPARVQRAWVEG